MKRPFAVFGFTLILSLLFASICGTVPSLVLGGALFLCFCLSFFLNKGPSRSYVMALCLAFVTGSFFFTLHCITRIWPLEPLEKQSVHVQAEVLEAPQWNGSGYVYYVKTETVSQEDVPQKLKLKINAKDRLEVHPSDLVEMDVQLFSNQGSREYGEGYYLRGRLLGNVKVTVNERPSLYARISAVQQHWVKNISAMLPGAEGTVLNAMVLGERTGVADELSSWFQDSGVYHLFAVSGLHVSLWAMAAFWGLRKLRMGMRPAAFASIAVTGFYMALTGFSMPVLRAGLMMVLLLLGKAFFRQADSLNSLGFSVCVICVLFPAATASLSFLMTVSASLGILTMGSSLCRKYAHTFEKSRLRFILTPLLQSLFLSASIMLFTLPVQLIYFKTFVPLSLLSNLVFVPLGTFTILSGGLAAVCSGFPFLVTPLAFAAGLGAKAMIALAKACASFPVTTVGIGDSYLLLWMAVAFVLTGCAYLFHRDHSLRRLAAGCSAALLLVSIGSSMLLNRNLLELQVLDVGNGTAVMVFYKGYAVLIGCGGGYQTKNVVRDAVRQKNKKQLDLLIIPRFTQRESGALGAVLQKCGARAVLMPEKRELQLPGVEKCIVKSSATIDFDPALRVQYKYWEKHYSVLLQFGDSNVLIMDSQPGEARPSSAQLGNKVHVLITGDTVPRGLQGGLQILSGGSACADKAAQYRQAGMDATATGGDGTLRILINETGGYCIRRETAWLQSVKAN